MKVMPAQMDLGRVGIWSGQVNMMPARAAREAASAIEGLGFQTLWYPEGVTKEAFSQAATLLAATEHLVLASGIANIWARDAVAMVNGGRTLVEAFPNRFVLGVGVSHAPTVAIRGHTYQYPLSMMRAYLEAMEAAPYRGPTPSREAPLVLAALGPKMLRLAAERAWGAHPYFVPVEHTSSARSEMGDGPLIAPEQAAVLSSDADEARLIARNHMEHYLRLDNYRNNLLRLGWPEADLASGGSDEMVDAIVAWGDVDAIRGRVVAHLQAGANHVCVQLLNGPPDAFPLTELSELAPALLDL